MSLCLLPILLGIGYIAAWELVGAVLFRGLLWEPPTLDDMWLHLDIACLLAGVYGIATATAFAVHGFMRQRK